MKFYEIKLFGEDLIAIPCEEFDPYSEEVDGCVKPSYFGGRSIYSFFVKCEDGYQFAWGQNIYLYRGKIYLILNDSEDFNSKNPIDRFSWDDDEDKDNPQHKIILENLNCI